MAYDNSMEVLESSLCAEACEFAQESDGKRTSEICIFNERKTTISARTPRPARGLFHFKVGRLSNHDDNGNKNPTNLRTVFDNEKQ